MLRMYYAIVGSRTFPATAAQWARMSRAEKRAAEQWGYERVRSAVERFTQKGDTINSGGAKGPDRWAIRAARVLERGYSEYLADWERYGKRAGMERNTLLVKFSDAVVAFWDGESHGTRDTICKAHAAGKPVLVLYPDPKRYKANAAWRAR